MKWSPLVLLGAILLVSGCGKAEFGSANPSGQTGVFRYPMATKPTTMDPAKVQDGDTIDLLQQVYEGLVGWNEKNEIEPKLADKWDVIDGGKSYVFHLRKGVKFHNGREMTADDVKFCFERACDPKLASPTAATYMSDIVGASDRIKGKASSIQGVTVVDKSTVKISILEPRVYFIDKLTYPCMFVYAKEALVKADGEMATKPEMIGTGPFKIDEIAIDSYVHLVANEGYFGGAPKLKRIERPVVPDSSTRLNLFKAGKIDLIQLERADVKNLKEDAKYKDQLHYFDRASMWYIGIHCNKIPALKDPRVRRAIAMAIDKDDIVDNILDGINKRADSIVPPGCFGHRDKVNGVKFDVAGAKKLLADAGHPDGKGIDTLTMYYRDSRPDIDAVAQRVGSQLKKNLGINVTFQQLQWGTYLDKNNKKELPFFHMRWAADYLDAENFLSTLLASYGAENKTEYKNAKYDELCHRADVSQDPAERLKLYAEAEDIVLQEAPFVPIYFQRDAELISPRVKGLRDALFGHLPHTSTSIE